MISTPPKNDMPQISPPPPPPPKKNDIVDFSDPKNTTYFLLFTKGAEFYFDNPQNNANFQ